MGGGGGLKVLALFLNVVSDLKIPKKKYEFEIGHQITDLKKRVWKHWDFYLI